MCFHIKTVTDGSGKSLNFYRHLFADNVKTFTVEDRGKYLGKQIAENVAESRLWETLQIANGCKLSLH